MNDRGQYGSKPPTWVGQTLTSGERPRSSGFPWIFGALSIGASVLWARHQAHQIERLYKVNDLPYQSFGTTVRATARELPARARAAYRDLTGRRPVHASHGEG